MPDDNSPELRSLAQLLNKYRDAAVSRDEEGRSLLEKWDSEFGGEVASAAGSSAHPQPAQNRYIKKRSFDGQEVEGSDDQTKDQQSGNTTYKKPKYDSDDETRKYQQWLSQSTPDELGHDLLEVLLAPRSQGRPVLDKMFEAARIARNRMVAGVPESPSQPNSTHDNPTAMSTGGRSGASQSGAGAAAEDDKQTDGTSYQG